VQKKRARVLRLNRLGRLAWRVTDGVRVPCTRTRVLRVMVLLSIFGNQVRDEGNCGEVTNRGEEACEDVRKRRVCQIATRTSSRQSCEATNRKKPDTRPERTGE